ncbi:MAG: DUF808 domain-containing protein [Oceanicoccus sp.]
MASAGLLALLDDIATLLDDVSILTKVAVKKTAGVLGDDLALNAEQVSGVRAERELPVVWAVAKGSAKNKLILVPAALLLSAFVPWVITPLLMLGGIYLCFEGFEKIAHSFFHADKSSEEEHQVLLDELADPEFDLVAFEKEKIRGAIRTDFILSAEIVVIVLGTVQNTTFAQQVLVVSLIAAVITVGVYGLVAGIVKLDDAGISLMASTVAGIPGRIIRASGRFILSACPYLMKTLSIVGTAAMFLVGGGILVHGIPGSHNVLHYFTDFFQGTPVLMYSPEWFTVNLFNAISGIVAGGLAAALMALFLRLKSAASK